MAEEDRWARAPYHSVSGTVTHSFSRQSACDGRKGGGVLEAKKEECFMAERTWKYARVASTKKKTMVSMGEDAACVETGRIRALIAGKWCGRQRVQGSGD